MSIEWQDFLLSNNWNREKCMYLITRIYVGKSVGKNTTVLKKINEAKTPIPPVFCLLTPASSQLQIFTPFYLETFFYSTQKPAIKLGLLFPLSLLL